MDFPAALRQRFVVTSTRQVPPAPATPASARPRLAGIDGLRAVAALWVVLFHMRAASGASFSHVPLLKLFLLSGSTGVSLFLVLSGLCLYLPFAGGRWTRFRTRAFFVRRCRRLMPAYYASLAVLVVVMLTIGSRIGLGVSSLQDLVWQLATHLTMTHSLFPSSFYALDGAYWSLGLEWQLYLALPLVIWGISRFGLARVVGAIVAVDVVYRVAIAIIISAGVVAPTSLLATAVLPNLLPGRWAEFAFGMVAAELYVSGRLRRLTKREHYALMVAMIPLGLLGIVASARNWPVSHILFGGFFLVLVIIVLAEGGVISRVISWRPLVAVGIMSYSLYLVHQPIVGMIANMVHSLFHTSRDATFMVSLLFLPIVFLAALTLYLLVERRSMRPASATPAAPATPTASALTPSPSMAASIADR